MAGNETDPCITNYQHYEDVEIDLDDNGADVYVIVQRIQPNWSRDDIIIKRLQGTGGFVNKTYTCFHRADLESQNHGLFIRINDPGMEGIFINRKAEIR